VSEFDSLSEEGRVSAELIAQFKEWNISETLEKTRITQELMGLPTIEDGIDFIFHQEIS
jgi:hypothetical protein